MEQLITTLERHSAALQFAKRLFPKGPRPKPAEPTELLLSEAHSAALTEMIDAEILYSISLHPIWLHTPIFGELIVTKLYLDLGLDKEFIQQRFASIVNKLTTTSLETFADDDELDRRFIHYITLKTLTGNTRILASLKASLGEKFMAKMVAVAEGMVRSDSDMDYFSFFDRLEDLMVQSIEDISAALAADASYLRKVEFYHYFWENGYLAASKDLDRNLAFAIMVAMGVKKQVDISKLRIYLIQHYEGVAREQDIAAALGLLEHCQLVFKANKVKTAKRQQYSLTSAGVAITRHEVSRKIVAGQQKPVEQLASYNPAFQQAATELLDPANQDLLLKKLNRMSESFAFCRS